MKDIYPSKTNDEHSELDELAHSLHAVGADLTRVEVRIDLFDFFLCHSFLFLPIDIDF